MASQKRSSQSGFFVYDSVTDILSLARCCCQFPRMSLRVISSSGGSDSYCGGWKGVQFGVGALNGEELNGEESRDRGRAKGVLLTRNTAGELLLPVGVVLRVERFGAKLVGVVFKRFKGLPPWFDVPPGEKYRFKLDVTQLNPEEVGVDGFSGSWVQLFLCATKKLSWISTLQSAHRKNAIHFCVLHHSSLTF